MAEQITTLRIRPPIVRLVCSDGGVVEADARALSLWSGFIEALVRRESSSATATSAPSSAHSLVCTTTVGVAPEEACRLVVDWCEFFYDELATDDEQVEHTHSSSSTSSTSTSNSSSQHHHRPSSDPAVREIEQARFLLTWKARVLGLAIRSSPPSLEAASEIEARWRIRSSQLRQWEAKHETVKAATAYELASTMPAPRQQPQQPQRVFASSTTRSSTTASSPESWLLPPPSNEAVTMVGRDLFAAVVLVCSKLQFDGLLHWLTHPDATGADIITEKRLVLGDRRLLRISRTAIETSGRRSDLGEGMCEADEDHVLSSMVIGRITWNRAPDAGKLDFLADALPQLGELADGNQDDDDMC